MTDRGSTVPPIVVGLNAVIVAVTKESPRILTLSGTPDPGFQDPLRSDGRMDVLPYGPLDPEADRTLELALRGWVQERTGLDLGYVEQLYTFGDRDRGGRARPGASRVISVAYLALVREDRPEDRTRAVWRDCYTYFPWEDWREGEPSIIRQVIGPALREWVDSPPDARAREERRERAGMTFGTDGAEWDSDRVLDRYELLYEMGLAAESTRAPLAAHASRSPTTDPGRDSGPAAEPSTDLGRAMDMDHRRILATALGRIRGKLRYRPVVFELVPETFTLLRLQRVVEALVGLRLHKQNFRRLVERGGLVEGTGALDPQTGGRPAELFRFRREVLRERRAPGVRLPRVR